MLGQPRGKHESNSRCGGRRESRMGPWSKGRSRTETWAEPVERKYRRKAGMVLDSKTSSPGHSS